MRRRSKRIVEWPITEDIARDLAGQVGIDYDALPRWLSITEVRELLGLKTTTQIWKACDEGRFPGAESFAMRGKSRAGAERTGKPRRFWRLPRNGVVLYAHGRTRGPQPPEGVPHLKRSRGAVTALRERRKEAMPGA